MKDAVQAFIERWENSGAAERANYQLFLTELCTLLGMPLPDPATPDTSGNAYVFERAVTFTDGEGRRSTGFIDLYKRGCFVLEAKQGAEAAAAAEPALSDDMRKLRAALKKGTARRGTPAWDAAMLRAKGQADQYIRALPVAEGRPPFLIVVDVGHSLELYSEFSCTGGTYTPFPVAGSHRIFLRDLERPDLRERLRLAWTDPHALDPTRRSARVTRDIAAKLAALAKALEEAGHEPHAVAAFLMRCLFTMFAEDVWLLPKGCFSNLLESLRDTPDHFVPMAEELWQKMNTGGFSTSLRLPILQFNGGLFEDATALPLNRDQFLLLIEAAACDWRDVEPAIFGTLLERAVNPIERHKLGGHFTPRAYVERLVLQTVMAPLRTEWEAVQAAAVTLANSGDTKKAAAEVRRFHRRLCELRILDPACGTANFLYVTFDHLKRLEQELFDTLDRLGDNQRPLEMAGQTVFPNQFIGLEVNPRAAAIAELVLWIGALQWHYRSRGAVQPPQPIIRNFHNIECRDAVLAWDTTEPLRDADGNPVTRWDGRTMKLHPATGREVPDESARVPVVRYLNPRPAAWPQADFVVGNPPFIGAGPMRQTLGDGYVEALRSAHGDVPDSSDFVMYWWNQAADLVRAGAVRRFGLVTTNSLSQTFNRRVVERHLAAEVTAPSRSRLGSEPRTSVSGVPPSEPRASASGLSSPALRTSVGSGPPAEPRASASGPSQALSLLFAIPDHPWVDAADGAAVRIAMTVGGPGKNLPGALCTVTREEPGSGAGYDVTLAETRGVIHADLTVGADVTTVASLKANEELSCRGIQLMGSGFIVTPEEAAQLGLGRILGLERHIRPYRNGRDLTDKPRGVMVIDLYGLSAEEVRERFPEVYQWVAERVKPEREQNNRASYRDNWWVFGEPRRDLRPALAGLPRFIATVETSKHRFFVFLDVAILPDNKLVVIASDDAWVLGVLSSRIHISWACAKGSLLEDRPVYPKGECFETFPFPAASEEQKARIRALGEQLDAHRKARQALFPDLTLTGMYNVLEKLRAMDRQTGPGELPRHSRFGVPVACDRFSAPGPAPAEPGRQAGPDESGAGSPHSKDRLSAASNAAAASAKGPADFPPALTPKERQIHEQGLITVLRELHDELDRAVLDAYGWSDLIGDTDFQPVESARESTGSTGKIPVSPSAASQVLLQRLVDLNAARAAEEKSGLIRWLRPEYQNPGGATAQPGDLGLAVPAESATTVAARTKHAWPRGMAERVQALRAALTAESAPVTIAEIASRFSRAAPADLTELLDTLVLLGHVRRLDDGRYCVHTPS